MDENLKETYGQNVTLVGGAVNSNVSGITVIADDVVIAGGDSDGKVTTLGLGKVDLNLGKVNLGATDIADDMAQLDVGGVSAEEGSVPEGEVRIPNGATVTVEGAIGSPEDHNSMIIIKEGATAIFNVPGFASYTVIGPAEFPAAELYSRLTPDAGAQDVTEEAPTIELHSGVDPLGASDVDHVGAY